MRLRILGANGEARGAELEALTQNILKSLGYENINKNRISHGGHEIDVEATYSQPTIGNNRVNRLLCECKAHANPIGTSEWLKFLGKVFTEMKTSTHPVSGLLVALSGVNGNVVGQYEELKKHCTDVEIVTGDNLVNAIERFYNLRTIDSVIREVQQSTHKSLTEIDLAYFAREFVYVVTFSDNSYCLVPSNNKFESSLKRQFLTLLSRDETLGTILDLEKERESIQQQKLHRKFLLTALLFRNGIANEEEITRTIREYLQETVVGQDIVSAISHFVDLGILTQRDDSTVELRVLNNEPAENTAMIFRSLLSEIIIHESLGLPLYDQLIDNALLKYISEIHDLPEFCGEDASELLKLLRWSPTALLAAVNRPIFPPSGPPPKIDDAQFLEFRVSIFKQELINRFIVDFQQPQLARYFFEKRNLREIETNRSLQIKSLNADILSFDLSERLAIGEAHESLGGGFLHLRLVPHAPQPYEQMPKKNDNFN